MLSFNFRAIPVFIVIIIVSQPLRAEHTTLPDMVVQGDNGAQALSLPSKDMAYEHINMTPGGVDLIDVETYKTGKVSTFQDMLGWSPGVYVQPRFGSDESRLSIRGSGLQRTFHLRGIKLLQDGVPINQADGGGDFQAVEPLALCYIEVYRGANALSYGSTTLGGAINFVSPSGYDAFPFQARGEFGSFGYKRAQASSGGTKDNLDYFISLSHFSQDGFRDHAEQDNHRLFGNIGFKLAPNIETRFFLTVANSDSQLPGNLTKAELKADPTQAAPLNVLNNQKRDYPLYRIANRTSFMWGNNQLDVSLFYTYKDLYHPIFQVLDVVSEDYGADFRFTNHSTLFGRRNIFTMGFTPVLGENKDDRFQNILGNRGARTAKSDQTAINLDLYAENQHYVLSNLAFVFSAQLTHANRELDDKFLTNGDNSFDEDYTGFSPKVGLRYEFNPDIQLFTNVSRSLEPPSFGEMTAGPGISPVDEQTATTFEIGTRGRHNTLRWDAVYYHAWVEDELLSLNDALGNPLGTVNANDTIHQGVELGIEYDLLDRLLLRQTYMWSDFRFDDDPVFGDNQLAGVPEHFFRTELVYHTPHGYYIGPNVEWAPDDWAVDHANTLFADGYAILGIKAGYRRPDGISFFVEGRNITDRKYAATTGVVADAGGLDSRQFLPGDGRSVFMGIEWRQ